MIKHKGLGRGLDALLGADTATRAASMPPPDREPNILPLSQLQPGKYQPRTRMDETSLQELASSIARHGMMQPIVVRAIGATDVRKADSRYEIIAGERRYRAATQAGLAEVPVIVKQVDDQAALAMALIENIQREDLNPLEEAQAIRRLIDEFHYSHEQASEAIGRSRSATSNLLRLLNLAEPVQTMLLAGDLDMGHARALLAVDRATQLMLAHEISEKQLSVRDAEKLVSRHAVQADAPVKPAKVKDGARDRDVKRLEESLSDLLGTTVTIRQQARSRGKLVIDFSGNEQFEGLLQRLGYQP